MATDGRFDRQRSALIVAALLGLALLAAFVTVVVVEHR
jgi:hypothetical protein